MFLDNMVLDRWAIFQAEYDIGIGSQANPYYAYPSAPNPILFRNYDGLNGYNGLPNNGIMAQDDPFFIELNSMALFRAENNVNPFNVQGPGFFNIEMIPQFICDQEDFNKKSEYEETIKDVESLFKVYPNPIFGDELIKIETAYEGDLTISITDIQGKAVMVKSIVSQKGVILIDGTTEWQNGMYFLSITGNNHKSNFKIIKL